MKINKRKTAVLCIVLLGILASGCGKKKTVDAESSQVIQISVAPVEATSTPAPDQVNSDAVITNGNLTMVNDYLADQDAADTSVSGTSDSENTDAGTNTDSSTDGTADDNAEDNSTADSEE